MALTPLGLETLAPGDSLAQDNYRFQSINPILLDRLARIGAITHRHDAHAAVVDPAVAPTIHTEATGGSIPAGRPIFAQYTWVDFDGGETLPSPVAEIKTAVGIQEPQDAPDAEVDNSAGALLAANFSYALTVSDGSGGETALGPPISVTVEPGFAHARVILTNLAVILAAVAPGIEGAQWRMWRAQGGGAWNLIATGTGASLTDDGTLVPDCTVSPPPRSTASGTNVIHLKVPAAPTGAQFFNLYACEDGSFTSPCLVAQHPVSESGETLVLTQLALIAGEPPLISTSYPGAHKIDPDKEIIAWPWRKSVTSTKALPTKGNEDGDVREALEDHSLHIWNASTKGWETLTGGGGAEIIEDGKGEALPEQPHLQFVGSAVKVKDDAEHTRTVVTIEGGTTGIVYRGAWKAEAKYEVNDIVTDAGGSYLCLKANEGVDPSTDVSGDWGILAAPGAEGGGGKGAINWRGPWSNSTTYAEDDGVSRLGGSYISTAAGNIGNDPATDAEAHWGILALPGSPALWRGEWAGGSTYAANDLVQREGSSWISLAAGNVANDPALDTSHEHWDLFAEHGAPGETGPEGPQGIEGALGPKGAAGSTGATGKEGPAGPEGPTGKEGKEGKAGPTGAAGKDGKDGEPGAGLNWRGPWKSGASYAVADGVQRNGSTFIAVNSGSGNDPLVPNLITNGNAETEEEKGVKGHGGATVSVDKAHIHSGKASFKVITSGKNSGISFTGLAWGTGDFVRAESWVFGKVGDPYRLAFFDGSVRLENSGVLPSTGWNLVTLSGTIASTTSSGELLVDSGSSSEALEWWLDDNGAYVTIWDLVAAAGGQPDEESAKIGDPIESKSWALEGEFETGDCPGYFVRVEEGRQLNLVAIETVVGSGSAEIEVKRNGAAILLLDEIAVSEAPNTIVLEKPISLASGDYITINVKTASGPPSNLAFTIHLAHHA